MERSETISFRLSARHAQRLRARARDRDVSKHEYARETVLRDLEQGGFDELRKRLDYFADLLEAIADELASLRVDLFAGDASDDDHVRPPEEV